MDPQRVPPVTTEDLLAFHAKHFSESGVQPDHTLAVDAGAEAEDDGLGFYPDGAKRTLTDEQIAMFRFSEAHKLLRERQEIAAQQKQKEEANAQEEADARIEEGALEPVQDPEELRKSRLEAALWASQRDWSESASTHKQPEKAGETVACPDAVSGQTFFWPKLRIK